MSRCKVVALVAALSILAAASVAQAALSDVTLQVYTQTGEAKLVFNVQAPLGGYDIISASGQLLPANLVSLATRDSGWSTFIATTGHIAEGKMSGNWTQGPNVSVSLGLIFTPNGVQDLRFSWLDEFYQENAMGPLDSPSYGVEYVNPIPEPASLAIWSLIGVGIVGLRAARRRVGTGAGRPRWSPESREAIRRVIDRGSRR